MSFAWPWSFLLAIPLGIAAWRMLRRGRQAGDDHKNRRRNGLLHR